MKRPWMKADMDEDLQASRRAGPLQPAPRDEVLQSPERPQPEPAPGAHPAPPHAVRRGQHEQAVHPQDTRQLLDHPIRGVRVLEHLAGDDYIEGLIADGELADVSDESAAARPGDRPSDLSLGKADGDRSSTSV